MIPSLKYIYLSKKKKNIPRSPLRNCNFKLMLMPFRCCGACEMDILQQSLYIKISTGLFWKVYWQLSNILSCHYMNQCWLTTMSPFGVRRPHELTGPWWLFQTLALYVTRRHWANYIRQRGEVPTTHALGPRDHSHLLGLRSRIGACRWWPLLGLFNQHPAI